MLTPSVVFFSSSLTATPNLSCPPLLCRLFCSEGVFFKWASSGSRRRFLFIPHPRTCLCRDRGDVPFPMSINFFLVHRPILLDPRRYLRALRAIGTASPRQSSCPVIFGPPPSSWTPPPPAPTTDCFSCESLLVGYAVPGTFRKSSSVVVGAMGFAFPLFPWHPGRF